MGNALTERGKAAISLSNALQTVAGTNAGIGDTVYVPHNHEGRLPQSYAVQTIIAAGVLTSMQVDIEGSLDGVNWTKLDTLTNVAGEISSILGIPVPHIRANYKAGVVGSGAPTLTVLFSF